MAIVADLRVRCPWDRVQTRTTLRPYLVEEVHELDHALGEGDSTAIREEVSDLLLHLAWQLVLARELEEFSPDDVANDLERKMQRRHPHLFDLGPREAWETLKRKENGRGLLEGRPRRPVGDGPEGDAPGLVGSSGHVVLLRFRDGARSRPSHRGKVNSQFRLFFNGPIVG